MSAVVMTIERQQKLIAFIDAFADEAEALACAEELIALKDLELNSVATASAILDDHETRIVTLEP